MLAFASDTIIKGHRFVTGLLESLYSDRLIAPDKIYVHLGELQLLRKNSPLGEQSSFNNLCLMLQERLAHATKRSSSLSPKSRREMIEACDELRIRIVASALSVAQCLGGSAGSADELLDNLEEGVPENLLGTIVHGPAELTHAGIGTTRVLILPRFENQHQFAKINEGLFGLLESLPEVQNWIIDFSLVEELPPLFFANLYAAVRQLRLGGSDLHLCWVSPELFSPAQLPKCQAFFRLKLVGGYYFSSHKSGH